MTRKKTLALLLCVFMLIGMLAGCGGTTPPATSSDAPAASSDAPALPPMGKAPQPKHRRTSSKSP